MVLTDGIGGSAVVTGWSEALGELHRRIGRRFVRSEARERARRYLVGLLGTIERKNGWQLAEAIGERDPQGVQRLLNSARWDADDVRDDLREYVVGHLGDEESGILIVDETGFLKKGEKSAGVARQYTGTAGDTVNCQVGVFLAYASERGAAFVDRALYLPRAWTNAPARRAEAGVPEEIVFRNKVELAEVMLERAFAAGVPARWVVADSFYGRLHSFREWLEERGRPYAVMVPKTNSVPLGGRKARHALREGKPLEVAAIAPEEARLTDEQWTLVSPLLPPQRGGVGRPPNDHRVVLGGILWVARTGSSWREMPEEYGKWETAYRRHELWAKQGLWPRLLRALGEEGLPGPATKEPN